MRYRIAPADWNHLAKKDTLRFPSDGGVSQTHYQGLRSMVVCGTLHKEPAELLSIAVVSPLSTPERSGGASKPPRQGPSWGGAGGTKLA